MKENFTLIKYYLKLSIAAKSLLVSVLFVLSLCSISSAQKINIDSKIATDWAKMTLKIMKDTPGGTPTFGSRFVGYCGLTMYETLVHGSKTQHSLAGKLDGLDSLPLPNSGLKINYRIALNAGQASIIKSIYDFASKENFSSIDSLEEYYFVKESKGFTPKEVEASVSYGKRIAKAIFEWSKTDGGHQGYLRNFDSSYIYPRQNGNWRPPVKGQSAVPLPLHPYWGKNRTFSKANYSLPIPDMCEYGYLPETKYFNYMKEVHDIRLTLTQEQKEISMWWGDDPSESFSPPGHSYYMALTAIENSNSDLFKASKTFAGVGMAVADAFINCWKTKYYYHAERPFTFIYYNLDTMWNLFWPEPPFPAFYSGHAGQASSAATVLTNFYGDKFDFIDNAHLGRPSDPVRLVDFKPRHFHSFMEAAEESAMSRLYGGIHTRHDNEVGLVEGKKIGENINQLFNTKSRN